MHIKAIVRNIFLEDLGILEAKEIELANSLREKYGDGTIDPQTGEITSL